ncbi:MAG: outer membrane lipoprotein-sorting protein [Gammaproteobacteria bacterium]|nr:outer membrane lipoprotein-sorting protein [Gammaproteobacteria bacterium]
MARPLSLAPFCATVLLLSTAAAVASPQWSGADIMAESARRHEHYPHVYEEQSLILDDAAGHRVSYRLRRFSRIEADGTLRLLLVFDDPPEVRGVALRSIHGPDGSRDTGLYLPAFGPRLKGGAVAARQSRLLGTDFTVGDLLPEDGDAFRYRRLEDRTLGEVPHYVVEAELLEDSAGVSRRRHFLRQDNLFIVRTDYYDRRGRVEKTRTRFDLKAVDGDMWRADMVLMEDHRRDHRSLIKVLRRVFSRDYVPARLFEADWLLTNSHIEDTAAVPAVAPAGDGEG